MQTILRGKNQKLGQHRTFGKRRKAEAYSVEKLEDRFVPTFTANFTAGVLLFTSDDAADVLRTRVETDGSISFQSNNDPFASANAKVSAVTKFVINAGGGNDVVDLTGFDSSPVPLSAATLFSVDLGAGNDSFLGSQFAEAVQGGDGSDSILGNLGNDTLSGDLGNDSLLAGDGNDLVVGGAGLDTIIAGDGFDLLFGQDDNDLIFGQVGNDSIDGGNGNDSIDGGDGNDLIFGSAGNDLIFGSTGNDGIDGGAGLDSIDGNSGNDFIFGQDGDDYLFGSAGNDSIDAGVGNDSIAAGDGADLAFGSAGDDRIFGEGGNDSIDGNDGNDSISAGDGVDLTFGSGGDDLIFGEGGSDNISGGAGKDAVDGGAGNDLIFGDSGNDTLYGLDGDDSIAGGIDDDAIYVGTGKNVAYGESGNDSLYGSDDDYLSGGTGTDIATGASRVRGDDDFTSFVPFPGSGGGDTTPGTGSGDPSASEPNHSQALFGLPWPSGSNLTVSFAPDGTKIGTLTSDLVSGMNHWFSESQWKSAISRALETWAERANINFGFVSDSGVPFGSSASLQGDLKQADIRIGGAAISSESYAFTVPPDGAFAGSWSGDVVFNTSANFAASGIDLYTIALHEIGHALGFADNQDATSVMHYPYAGPVVAPSAADSNILQGLYGIRKNDQFEGSNGNNNFQRATRVDFSSGGTTGSVPAIAFGDLTSSADVDVFEVRTPSGYSGPLTVHIRTSGLSLLAPKATLYREENEVVQTVTSTSLNGDDLSVHLASVDSNTKYFVRVEAANPANFSIGSFALIATLDGRLATTQDQIETLLRLPVRDLKPDEIQKYFVNPEHFDFNDDAHSDDSIANSKSDGDDGDDSLKTSGYMFVGSFTDAADVDFYSVTAPNVVDQSVALIATVRSLDATGLKPKVRVVDALGNALPAEVLAHENGSYVVQLQGVTATQKYFFEVTSEQGTTVVGNYELNVRFTLNAAVAQQVVTKTVNASTPALAQAFYVAQTQLFHFGVTVDNVPNATLPQGVEAAIFDQNNQIVQVLSVRAGDTQTLSGILLQPGTYTVRLLGVTSTGDSIAPMNVSFRLVSLSDQTGPLLSDPTGQPIFPFNPQGGFIYPNGQSTTRPFLVSNSGTPSNVGPTDINDAIARLFPAI